MHRYAAPLHTRFLFPFAFSLLPFYPTLKIACFSAEIEVLARDRDYIYIIDYYCGDIIPNNVKEGTIVPITLKLKGAIIPYVKMEFVFKGGQWQPISATQI